MNSIKKYFPVLMLVFLMSSCSGQDKAGGVFSEEFSLLQKKEYDKALDAFSKQIEKNAQNPAAFLGRGLAQAGKGEHNKAIEDYNKATELLVNGKSLEDSLKAKLYLNRGLSYFAVSQFAPAKEDFSKAIELKYHNLSEALSYRGVCYGNLEDVNSAFKDLNEAIKLDPKNHYAVTNRGYYNSLVGDNQAAIKDLTTAVTLKPDDKVSFLNRGYTYLQMGDFPTALADFNKSYSLDTNYLGPAVYIGITKTNMGDNIGALPWFNKVIPWQPENPTLYYYRGTCLANLGRVEEACVDLKLAAEKGEPNALPMIAKFCK